MGETSVALKQGWMDRAREETRPVVSPCGESAGDRRRLLPGTPVPLCVIAPLWTILPGSPLKSDCTCCVRGPLGNGGRGVRSVFGLKTGDNGRGEGCQVSAPGGKTGRDV